MDFRRDNPTWSQAEETRCQSFAYGAEKLVHLGNGIKTQQLNNKLSTDPVIYLLHSQIQLYERDTRELQQGTSANIAFLCLSVDFF